MAGSQAVRHADMLSAGRKADLAGKQVELEERRTDLADMQNRHSGQGRKAGHIREKNRPFLKGRQDAGKHTYMQDIQAGMKLNRPVDSSHAGRLPDGKVGGQTGRQESRPVRQAQKAGIPVRMSWPDG
jgi:hypothetical protein